MSGAGATPPLPVPVSAGLRGPAGLPAQAVCHGGWGAEADRPGRRHGQRAPLPHGRRLPAPVPAAQLHGPLLRTGGVRGHERDEESLQCPQVRQATGLR